MAATRQWLVVSGKGGLSVYSLPGLQFQDQIESISGCSPRAGGDDMVYLGGRSYVMILEITNTGNLAVRRMLRAGGRLSAVWPLRFVAVGPKPGQVCTGDKESQNVVHVINIKNDSIDQTLVLPSEIDGIMSVAALSSGQVLVADWDGDLAWYRSVSERAVLLTNTPVVRFGAIMLGNNNQFLVAPPWGSQLYVMDGEGGWHTVGALTCETGVWLPGIMDVAVWESCVWVADYHGSLLLLCSL